MNVIEILKSKFVKAVGVTALVSQVAACADMDAGVATAAGAALGYGLGNELNSDWGGYAGGAIGGALANAAINNAQRCPTETQLGREAQVDNTTGRRTYDVTNQSQSTTCVTYGGSNPQTGIRPIF